MARKKKDIEELKKRLAKADGLQTSTRVEQAPSKVESAPDNDQVQLTKAQAVKKFEKDGKPVEFWSTRYKGFALAAGKLYIQFKDYKFKATKAAEVSALINSPDFRLHIFCREYYLRKAV